MVLAGVAAVRRVSKRATFTLADEEYPEVFNAEGEPIDAGVVGPGRHPLATADRRPTVSTLDTDVLVVGGGPAGSAVALRLARHGHRVTIVEKRPVPRHKACGDGLTPRARSDELALLDIDPITDTAAGASTVCG